MPLNGLTSGIQNKISFIDETGTLHFAILESFSAKEDATIPKYIGIDGTVRHKKFHQGWSGSFMLQREDNFLDAYIALQESEYYLGLDSSPVIITQTITENDGSINAYQYTSVVLLLESAGDYTGTDIVKESVSFVASRKLPLS